MQYKTKPGIWINDNYDPYVIWYRHVRLSTWREIPITKALNKLHNQNVIELFNTQGGLLKCVIKNETELKRLLKSYPSSDWLASIKHACKRLADIVNRQASTRTRSATR